MVESRELVADIMSMSRRYSSAQMLSAIVVLVGQLRRMKANKP
jgi:hypothetical protein